MTIDRVKFEPLYDRVLVRPSDREPMKNGIYVPDVAQEKPQIGEVIAVGGGRVLDNGNLSALTVAVGDTVIFGKYSGSEVEINGERLIVMKEADIFGVFKGEAQC